MKNDFLHQSNVIKPEPWLLKFLGGDSFEISLSSVNEVARGITRYPLFMRFDFNFINFFWGYPIPWF